MQIRQLAEAGSSAASNDRPGGAALPSDAVAGRPPAAESTALDVARRSRPPAASAELDVGSVLENRYRVVRLLGRGGMGAVYLADDEVLGEQVALKVISAALDHQPAEMIERFRREASAARKVSSPNVIRIHDLGQTRSGLLYISMEYFPGKTLARLLDLRGTLGELEIRDVIGQICAGLGAAHAAAVIHRDLKPQNVLVGERSAVKLIDFGLAKVSSLHGMTASGLILGTPQYMSPEQIKGLEVDARSDIYSLGALTYHAVAGRPPFSGATPIAVGFAHLTEPPRPPRELRPDLSPRLNGAILAALEKNPADRPQTVGEFQAAI
jgi:serine/threonine-protein kinase